jgi:hypothetical protein
MLHFGNATSAVPSDDADQDGFTNAQEYLSGSLPQSASSRFATSISTPIPGTNGFTLTWNAIPGRVYTLQRTFDLALPFTDLATGITHPQSSFTDAGTAGRPAAFYRVTVSMP